jgi:hypothetical protein
MHNHKRGKGKEGERGSGITHAAKEPRRGERVWRKGRGRVSE